MTVVMFPSPKCKDSPILAHYYVCENTHLWRCKWCSATVLLPRNWESCKRLDYLIERYGLTEGYWEWLETTPELADECQLSIRGIV